MTSISKIAGSDLTSLYESIRSYVLEGNLSDSRLGLSVILQEGMISWMDKVSQPCRTSSPFRTQQNETTSANGFSAIVSILVNMAYFSLKEDGVL